MRSNPKFMAPKTPDQVLAAIVGPDPIPRPHVVKKLWEYIKLNGLQEKTNRRMINADDKLRPLFDGQDQVNMMKIGGFLSKHLT